ncbi:MAG: hypothetical protein KG028_15925 [Actinobacteria bacterium]|nr:hypothetical protein [Actinomycetota bacterium]
MGLVTSSDLLRLQYDNPVHLVAEITAAPDVATLARVSSRIGRVLEQLVAEDATANDMGRAVTALGDAIERRLLALAERELGPAPTPYCWVVLGTQARKEQGLASDQDNALILDPAAGAESDEWFAALATRVRDGLAACGYRPCPGEVMASNPRWRVPVDTWRSYFSAWARTPEPDAVLNAGIFYDMRPLHGDADLVAGLREQVLAETRQAGLLLAYLAKQAVAQRPPIGFFRGLVLEKEGMHRDRLDLKAGGVGSVVQVARVHALAAGGLSVGLAAELHDAYHRPTPRFTVADTLRLQRRVLGGRWHPPEPEELRLQAARERFGLPRYRAHDALTDALACAELYLAQVARLAGDGPLAFARIRSRTR